MKWPWRQRPHEHQFVPIGSVENAPITTGQHTAFAMLKCVKCPVVQVIPQSNYDLTTVAFKKEFEADLARSGHTLEVPEKV